MWARFTQLTPCTPASCPVKQRRQSLIAGMPCYFKAQTARSPAPAAYRHTSDQTTTDQRGRHAWGPQRLATYNTHSPPLPSCHWIGRAGTRVLCSCGQHTAHALAGRASSTLAAAAAPAPPRPRPAQSRRRPAVGRTPPPRPRGAGALQRARAASARRCVERVPAGAPCTCPRITKARAAFVAGTPQPPRLAPVSLAVRLARPACAPGGAHFATRLYQCPPVCTPRCSSRHAGPWGSG